MLSTRFGWSFRIRRRSAQQVKIALQLWQNGKRDEAISKLRRGAKRFPLRASFFESEAASLLMSCGEWEQARTFWVSAVKSIGAEHDNSAKAKSSLWLLNAATCAYLMGDFRAAAIDLSISERLSADIRSRPEYILAKARLLKRISADQAVNILMDGARKFANDHALNYDAAELSLRLGRYNDSLVFAKQAADLRPKDEPSRRLFTQSSEKAKAAALRS